MGGGGGGGGALFYLMSADSLHLKFIQFPPVRSHFDETLICKDVLLANIFKSVEGIFISIVKIKIWQIFLMHKANWNPQR